MERYFSGLVRNFDAFFYDFWVVAVGWCEISIYVGGGVVGLERFERFWSGIVGRRGRFEKDLGLRMRRSGWFGAVRTVLERYCGSSRWVVARSRST